MLAYFCGVWPSAHGEVGHYAFLPSGQWAPDARREAVTCSPWGSTEEFGSVVIDAAVARVLRAGCVPRPGQGREPEGVRCHAVRDGWTLVCWWDRSGDQRYNSVAGFAFDAVLTADEAEAEARRRFPTVWARMDRHLGRTTRGQALRAAVLAAVETATEQQLTAVAALLRLPGLPAGQEGPR